MPRPPWKRLVVVPVVGLLVGTFPSAGAAEYAAYRALDPSLPVSFDGTAVTWNSRTFVLDEHTLFPNQ